MWCTDINNYITTYNNIIKKCLPIGKALNLTNTTSSSSWQGITPHKRSGIVSLAGGRP